MTIMLNVLSGACCVGVCQVIAQNLQKLDPKSDGAKRDWVAIYDECASVLYEVHTHIHIHTPNFI